MPAIDTKTPPVSLIPVSIRELPRWFLALGFSLVALFSFPTNAATVLRVADTQSADLDFGAFVAATRAALQTTAMVMIVIGCAAAFGWVLAVNEVPAQLAQLAAPLVDNPILLLLLINVMLLLGAIMDMAPLIMIMTPILLLILEKVGVEPIQFGMLLILNLGIGLLN